MGRDGGMVAQGVPMIRSVLGTSLFTWSERAVSAKADWSRRDERLAWNRGGTGMSNNTGVKSSHRGASDSGGGAVDRR